MAAPESVRRAYQNSLTVAEAIQRHVGHTLQRYCDDKPYLFFDRIKLLDSLSEKLETGRYKRWVDIDDIYAATIVIPTASHEPEVLETLNRLFNRRTVRSRGTTKKAPDVFRFDTTRFYGTVTSDAGALLVPGADNFIFEIQIPTVFEFAWATVTHDLVYKSGTVDWRRERLAAQLKAAVEQIETIIQGFEHMTDAIPASTWDTTEMRTDIVQRFQFFITQGLVRPDLCPTSWSRFADNVVALVQSYQPERSKVRAAIDMLLHGIEGHLRRAQFECPTSGTLFQLVLGYTALDDSAGSLKGFWVVPSEELPTLYGIRDITKSIQMLPQ